MYTEYPQLLGALRTIRAEHPQGAELLADVRSWASMMDPTEHVGNAFDVAEALHYISTLWHGGQGCPLYLGQCTEFEPGPCWRRPERDTMGAGIAASMTRTLRNANRS